MAAWTKAGAKDGRIGVSQGRGEISFNIWDKNMAPVVSGFEIEKVGDFPFAELPAPQQPFGISLKGAATAISNRWPTSRNLQRSTFTTPQ